ncbi:MAG: hypothetical protein WB424_19290 [Terracidiphilus sp.]
MAIIWKIISMSSVLLFIGMIPTCAETCGANDNIKALVIADVQNANRWPGWSEIPFFAIERDDLAGDIIAMQYSAKTSALKRGEPGLPVPFVPMRVFEVSNDGDLVENAKIVRHSALTDDSMIWRVAYNCLTKQVFHLYGFTDSAQGFNEMMSTMQLVIDSSDLAKDVQYLWVKLMRSPGTDETIRSRHRLLMDFLDNYPTPDVGENFWASWSRFSPSLKRSVGQPIARQLKEGFAVTFYIPADVSVQRIEMKIGPNGSIDSLAEKSVANWPVKR